MLLESKIQCANNLALAAFELQVKLKLVISE